MKMNSQSRNFAKRVQVDLLALSDADLFHTVHEWVGGTNAAGVSSDISDATRLALGYTRLVENETRPHLLNEEPEETEREEGTQWQAPSPHHLRALITAMDVNVFTAHVITPAFQFLHPAYPEWYEGVTFNAHLANHLRRMVYEAANHKQKA
jgi:hypothetical protein